MKPDYMAKYSLPLLTDLTENLIQIYIYIFYVLTLLHVTVLRMFLNASRHSVFTHVVFSSKKQMLTKNIRGQIFVGL
jgi:hypothetical protein